MIVPLSGQQKGPEAGYECTLCEEEIPGSYQLQPTFHAHTLSQSQDLGLHMLEVAPGTEDAATDREATVPFLHYLWAQVHTLRVLKLNAFLVT